MCVVGDIIVIKEYVHNGFILSRHSFVVLSDEADQIQGLDYNLICNVMSSFKTQEQKEKKLRFVGNFPISYTDSSVNGNTKDGYIKAEQLYYFNKNKIDYQVIGRLNDEILEKLLDFIEQLSQIEEIIDNL